MPLPAPAQRPARSESAVPGALQATLFLVEPNHDLVDEEPAEAIEAVLSRTARSTAHANDTGARGAAFVLQSPRENRGWKRLYRLARVLLSRLAAPRDLVLVFVASSEVGPRFRAALFAVVSDLQATCGQRLSVSVRFREPQLLSAR